MSDGIWTALSGAVGQLSALDVAANNVANSSTPGYRADHLVFSEALGKARAGAGGRNGMRANSIGAIAIDQGQGAIVRTGRPLDVAIRGDGYFVVSTAGGDRYTRLGNLEVSREGLLVTRGGDPVLGIDRKKIKVPAGAADARIGPDGSVEVGGASVGQLLTVTFDKKAVLNKEGAVLLKPADSATAATPNRAALEIASLEQSNLTAVKGMMDIVGATRSFEACERVIDAFRDADRRAAMAIAQRVAG
jgi:flagellar basal body rod protein FlgG